MWWLLTILLFLISVITSVTLYFALNRITKYEEILLQIQQIVSFATERMKLVDSKGHYESDDETQFFFDELKALQTTLDGVFESQEQEEKTNG